MSATDALRAVAPELRCPTCSTSLTVSVAGEVLVCERSHRIDVARQGYVNLVGGRGSSASGDTAAMVQDRGRVHSQGLLAPVTEALRQSVAAHAGRDALIVDVGGGTGHHLGAVMRPGRRGVAVDVSVPAARQAARAHPQVAAVVADTWNALPLRDGVVDVLLNVFAPRNPTEFARVLTGSGVALVITPTSAHLGELVDAFGLLRVGPEKSRDVASRLQPLLPVREQHLVEFELDLDADQIELLVRMGPNAWHQDLTSLPQRIHRVLAGQDSLRVTASITLTVAGGGSHSA